ncbi:hypothetical protein IQ255_24560 [Pleurocapsales cyanobacterium LEGE 10410]|nr:hypothetical protein [Pleurocapsales cyanobacterium LEGE 10410]
MDQKIILNYVKLYQHLLERHQILLDDQDLNNIYHLILLVFKLDDLYDRPELNPPSPAKLAKIKTAMTSLMPDYNSLGLQAIDSVFRGMQDESRLIGNRCLSLEHYLKVSSQSIGASIIMTYLVSKIKLDPRIWYSDIIVKFNYQINVLIRLANDYLDIVAPDRSRSVGEIPQVKASSFFASKSHFTRFLLYRYIVHKLRYCFYQVKYRYLRQSKLSPHAEEYWQAIACSESVLDWAVQVYLIDRNSCQ